jgi:outer membrane protein OmpA-like peptidoglycan-associated protein
MNKTRQQKLIKLQAKRNVELWIYSFADLYMILSVFFIAIAVLFAAKSKVVQNTSAKSAPSAGRGLASVTSSLSVEFDRGQADLTESTLESLKLFLPVIQSSSKAFVDIEGYADREPLTKESPFSSNLDLSNRRAVKVAEWYLAQGVPAHQLRTFSYGSGHALKPDGTKVRSNRRVVIKINSTGGGT